MQTNQILQLLRTEETKLRTEINKTQEKTSKNSLSALKLLSMQSVCKLLTNTHNTLSTMHLLKTSISVTRTPLTTIKSLSKATANQSFTTP